MKDGCLHTEALESSVFLAAVMSISMVVAFMPVVALLVAFKSVVVVPVVVVAVSPTTLVLVFLLCGGLVPSVAMRALVIVLMLCFNFSLMLAVFGVNMSSLFTFGCLRLVMLMAVITNMLMLSPIFLPAHKAQVTMFMVFFAIFHSNKILNFALDYDLAHIGEH